MILTEEQSRLIEEIAKDNTIENCEIQLKEGSQKGDNFAGVITRVTLRNEEKELVIIMKSSGNGRDHIKQPESDDSFAREIFIYETLLPQFADYQKECNISNPFTAYPKIFKTGEGILFMEDMVDKGYQMCNKKITLNFNHLESILKEYAKFHSVSIAMNNNDPVRFKNLTKNLFDIFEKTYKSKNNNVFKEMIKPIMSHLYKAVENDLVATEVLKNYERKILTDASSTIDSEDMIAVTHGDCWCNNFLFKYEDDRKEKPSKVCIIDWQVSKLGCPTNDLSFCLLATGSKEVLNDYQKYLRIYYETLSLSLKDFGCDPEEVYPYELFEKQFKKYSHNMLFFCVFVTYILVCESDEVPDFSKIDHETGNFQEMLNFTLTNMDEYYRRLSNVVQFMVKNNLLSG